MPLLRKKVFQKQSGQDFLRDDEEVFYCETTNEIFRDYQEFSERMFLVNSMVWTCSMTGKSNLTYGEAQESEENARKLLKEFPYELKVPILYVATLTKRTSFGEMAEDVFIYAKDRYFIGENIEASFTPNKWKDSHIMSVIAPKNGQKVSPKNGSSPERNFLPSASLYKYEIEQLDSEDSDISEMMIVDCTQLRRKKVHFSRDKCKLFLKQYVQQDERGIFVIKPEVIERFAVNKINWDQIFAGPLPNFHTSKKFEKAFSGVKKRQRQETMAKYLKKNGLKDNKQKSESKPKVNGNLMEQMKKREEEFKKQKKLSDEQKAEIAKKKKIEANQMALYFKQWLKPKEDLELEDHMKLPVGTPVKTKIPDENFGDILTIMEFVHKYPKFLSTKDFFPGGFSFEIMERALSENEVAGPLTDIIQMLLTAIFNLQDEESKCYSDFYNKVTDMEVKEENLAKLNLTDGTTLATLASKWVLKYQGLPLSRLPLYPLTVSEVLRLHLLSSGAKAAYNGAKWRYQERGGYVNEDDPGLYFRVHQAHILKALAVHNIVQLSLNDKLQIILCLVNQILTYADVRDVIEEEMEKEKELKLKLRNLKISANKKNMDMATKRLKLRKDQKAPTTTKEEKQSMEEEITKLEKENEDDNIKHTREVEKILKKIVENQTLLGRDRAFRRCLKLDSVPGIFLCWEDELAGVCLDETVTQNPDLQTATRTQLMSHIKNMQSLNASNKENSSPKSPRKVIAARKSFLEESENDTSRLFMCTADESCPVHYMNFRQRWSFFSDKEQFVEFVKGLNKRGIREHELKEVLQAQEELMISVIEKTPVSTLNPEVEIKQEENENNHNNRKLKISKNKDKYEDANLGYPPEMRLEDVLENVLIENILEMEEKIFGGSLGALKIKDRDKWRTSLQNKNYVDFETLAKSIVIEDNKLLKVKKIERRRSSSTSSVDKGESNSRPNSRPSSRPSTPLIEEKEYSDPGKYVVCRDELVQIKQDPDTKTAIRCLASALSHVAEAVDVKYLKRPLGRCDLRVNNKHKMKHDLLEVWEQSLVASTNFSQVFLHYSTLDSCVMWSRSALVAKCRICRRQKDSENLLLCDNCNLGHHIYCLKPKLTAVPKGDWFCTKCQQKKAKEKQLLSPEPEQKKRRRIFVEEEDTQEEEEQSSSKEDATEEESGEESEATEEEEEADEEEEVEEKTELCSTCGSGGDMVACDKCSNNFHKECIEPPLRRLPRGNWSCPSCKHEEDKKTNVHANGFYKEVDSSDESHHGISMKKTLKRDESRQDLPLHNAAIQDLLTDVMKHDDAWPFLRPVQKREVPDYYDVISTPMDFGTIKYKLNMGKYTTDHEILKDICQIFDNCNTYNSNSDEVYQCGVRLSKFLIKKSKEHGLKMPRADFWESDQPKAKKRRTK